MHQKASPAKIFTAVTTLTAAVASTSALSADKVTHPTAHEAIKMNTGTLPSGNAQSDLARKAATTISKGLEPAWSAYETAGMSVDDLLTVFSDRAVAAANRLHKTGKPQIVGVGDSENGHEFGIIIDAKNITVFAREFDATTGRFTTTLVADRDTNKGPDSITQRSNPETADIGVSPTEKLPRKPVDFQATGPKAARSMRP